MKLVVHGAQLKCSQGTSPSPLAVAPANQGFAGDAPVATIQDYVAFANISPFGLCRSLANPQVAAATASHLGILTPMPCVPKTVAPWAPGSAFADLNGQPVLTDDSKCSCQWAGIIEVAMAGQAFATLEQGAGGSSALGAQKASPGRDASVVPKPSYVEVPSRIQRPEGHHLVHQFVCAITDEPIAEVRWRVRAPNGALVANGVTGGDGFLVVPVPEAGEYLIDYEIPTPPSPEDGGQRLVDSTTLEPQPP